MSRQAELEELLVLANKSLWAALDARTESYELLKRLRHIGSSNCCRLLRVGEFAIQDGCSFCRYEYRRMEVRKWHRVIDAYEAELAAYITGK